MTEASSRRQVLQGIGIAAASTRMLASVVIAPSLVTAAAHAETACKASEEASAANAAAKARYLERRTNKPDGFYWISEKDGDFAALSVAYRKSLDAWKAADQKLRADVGLETAERRERETAEALSGAYQALVDTKAANIRDLAIKAKFANEDDGILWSLLEDIKRLAVASPLGRAA